MFCRSTKNEKSQIDESIGQRTQFAKFSTAGKKALFWANALLPTLCLKTKTSQQFLDKCNAIHLNIGACFPLAGKAIFTQFVEQHTICFLINHLVQLFLYPCFLSHCKQTFENAFVGPISIFFK
jgi:hypothetical protein